MAKIHHPKIAIANKRFFREIDYPHSVPLQEADAILFPWKLKDTMVFSAPDSMLAPLRTLHKKKPPNWEAEFNIVLLEVSVKVLKGLLHQFRKKNNGIEIPIILLTDMDVEGPFWQDEKVLFFRCSLTKTAQLSNEFALPYLLQKRESDYIPSTIGSLPSVGFCGYPQHKHRTQLLESIWKSPLINDDFIYRNEYFWALEQNLQADTSKQLEQEYFANIDNNAFTVCSRGAGNYSIRFYETLRSGRIPVLLDSDMVFPFASEINWNEFIICKSTPQEVIDTMIEWWNTKDINAIQQQCYQVWKEYLSHDGFFDKLSKHLVRYNI